MRHACNRQRRPWGCVRRHRPLTLKWGAVAADAADPRPERIELDLGEDEYASVDEDSEQGARTL